MSIELCSDFMITALNISNLGGEDCDNIYSVISELKSV